MYTEHESEKLTRTIELFVKMLMGSEDHLLEL